MESTNHKSKIASAKEATKRSPALRALERVLAVIGACYIVYHLCFEMAVMTSESMAPTLRGTSYVNGDRILVERVTGHFRAPRRWEIYFYYDDDGNPVTKRVVGLPGEKIAIKEEGIYVNGAKIDLPNYLQPIKYCAQGNLARGREFNCGDGYFMLGDDSVDSYDSRYTGVVSKARFHGRAWCILSPRGRMGFVN
jgi:signal peptidase I